MASQPRDAPVRLNEIARLLGTAADHLRDDGARTRLERLPTLWTALAAVDQDATLAAMQKRVDATPGRIP